MDTGAKMASRNHVNKNMPHKNNDFMQFSLIERKNAIQILEGSRTECIMKIGQSKKKL